MRKNTLTHFAAAAMLAVSALSVNAQQLKTPAPSPAATVKQSFGLGDVTLDYSRPSAKGRTIYGDVVPFGKVWRTGANAATKITFTEDVKIEGAAVTAGTYAIYTIPNKDSWEFMLYKDLTLGGNTASYKAENEVIHVKVKPSALSSKVETFTMNLADVTATTAILELLWENTRVPVTITTDIDAKIMKNIEASVTNDARPYFQAASYYYDNNKDLNQALVWVKKAVEQNNKAFWVIMLQAKIEAKLNDKKAAIASAEKTIQLAKEAQNDDYVKMAEKLIAENKK